MTRSKNEQERFDLSASLSFASHVGGGSDGSVLVVYTNGERKDYKSLADLQGSGDLEGVIRSIRAGDVFSVDYKVLSFINTVNANNFRLKDGHLARGAKDTPNRPVLKDHRVSDTDSEVGVCGESEVISVRGKEALKTSVSAREPKFMENFVRGLHRAYSAHFNPDGQVSCGVCGAKGEMYGGRWAMLSCEHRAGFKVKDGEHKGKTGHYVFGVSGFKELSSTPNPAVQGARAMGVSFSNENQQDEEPEMAGKQEEKDYVDLYASTRADLIASQKEVDDLKATIATGQKQLEELAASAKEWKNKAIEAATRYLQEKRVVTNSERDRKAVKLQLSSDFDEGLAFFEERPARGDLSASQTGTEEGNATVDKKKSNDGDGVLVFGKRVNSLTEASAAISDAERGDDFIGFGVRSTK